MATARTGSGATLLPNGKVLAVGGYDGINFLSSAELYDPDTGTWNATANMVEARAIPSSTLLPNGKVLVAGGCNNEFCVPSLASAELYTPLMEGTPDTWVCYWQYGDWQKRPHFDSLTQWQGACGRRR